LLSQLPGGELLDASRSKRFLVALGGIIVAASALAIALWPSLPVVFAALVLQGITGGFLGPAIAAISLGLVITQLLPNDLDAINVSLRQESSRPPG
jgi:MFS family permease